jgi:hypothetical protein
MGSGRGVNLSRQSFELLLRLLEAREMVYPHSTLVGYYGPPGQELIDAGLMTPAGFGMAILDEEEDEQTPMAVEADPKRGLGYHSPLRGWVKVEKAELQRYRPHLPAIFRMLLGDELVPYPRGELDLGAGLCWEIGRVRLLRTGLVDVLFARRLDDPAARENVRLALERRPSAKLRLMLTTTQRLPAAALPLTKLVPVADVLSAAEPWRIDMAILRARFAGRVHETGDGPLHLSEDGRTLTINGTTRISFRSDAQIEVIRTLLAAYQAGKSLNAARTLADAGLSARTFKQAFGRKWPELRPYLVARDQLWSFHV